jgi:hypothetical protein
MMEPFIVCYGPHDTYDIVYALARAREFAMADSMSAEEARDEDYTWARPYDHWFARDKGLTWLDQHEKGWITAEARP